MYVTAVKKKGNPDITRGVEFVRSVGWGSTVLFTLNFSAN